MLDLQTLFFRVGPIAVLLGLFFVLSGCDDGDNAPATADQESTAETDSDDDTSNAKGAESSANAGSEHGKWLQNFEQAKATALQQGKDILMDFTGSDWCGWCIRLHREVFQYQTFHNYADKNFVLLELDFPQDKSNLTEEIIAQNRELQARFGIEGFPTILLLDSAGRPYAKTGYQAGGAENYVQHLAKLQELRTSRDTALKEAVGLEGVERAKKLDSAIAALDPPMIFPAYETEISQIIESDADNTAGLKEKYLQIQLSGRFQQRFNGIQSAVEGSDNVESVLAELEKLEQEFVDYPDGKKQSLMARMNILNGEGRFEDVLKVTEDLLKDETISDDDRRTYQTIRYSMQRQLKRNDEALATLDAMIKSAGESGDEKAQMLVSKSEFLVSLDRVDDARKVFDAAKQAAVSARARSALGQIEQQLFADVESKTPNGNPGGEKDPAQSPEAEKPEEENPMAEGSKESPKVDASGKDD